MFCLMTWGKQTSNKHLFLQLFDAANTNEKTMTQPGVILGVFNPVEKKSSKWESSPRFEVKMKKMFQTITEKHRFVFVVIGHQQINLL